MRKRIGRDKPEQRGAEAETQMWCEEPVWSEETLKSDTMEIPLSYTRITKMTCQDKPRQNVWIFKVKMETQSYQHSLGRESTGCLGREERKKKKRLPSALPFPRVKWQTLTVLPVTEGKSHGGSAMSCRTSLTIHVSKLHRHSQAGEGCEHMWVHASSSQGKMDSRERCIYQLPAAQGWWPQTSYFTQIAYIDLFFQRK